MLIRNDENNDKFRATPESIVIYICLFSSLATQTRLARGEFNAMKGSRSISDHIKSLQNVIDITAIVYSVIYCAIRFAHPSQAWLGG